MICTTYKFKFVSSLEWRHKTLTSPGNERIVPSAVTVMATVFWNDYMTNILFLRTRNRNRPPSEL